MQRIKTPLVTALLSGAVAILSAPSTAGALTIHQHVLIARDPAPPLEVVRVVDVAPPDRDDDGFANSEDNCPSEPYSGNGGCEPDPVTTSVSEGIAPGPASSSETASTAGVCGGITPYEGGGQCWAIPYAIVSCESGGSYTAYNPSGASGAYQLMIGGGGSPAEQDAAAAALWAGGAGQSNWDPSDACSGY